MHRKTTNHVNLKYILSIKKPCLNPFRHTSLPTYLSHSLVQSGPAPHRATATRLPFRSIYSIRWGEQSHIVEKVQYSLSMQPDTKNNRLMGKWVHDQFGKSSKSRYCACCMEKKDNAASKKNRSKRVTTTAYREKRVRLLGKVVTKHQLPKPRPRGGKWTRWPPVNPQR